MIGTCFLVSFLSASQDIVVDAFRRESLREEEFGLGSTVYVYGYRIAMFVTGGVAMILADHISWPSVYMSMAVCMAVGVVATFLADEPAMQHGAPKNFYESVVLPLKEFFQRKGVLSAFTVLSFIILYKIGEVMAGAMATPFYKALGFTNTEIGAIAKTWGFISLMVGGFFGGALILKVGLNRALLICGILQGLSTACIAFLATLGHSLWALTWVISFEDIASGMGTSAFVAFMATQTNTRFTATQYALLTSLMGVPRTLLAAPTGIWAEKMGWQTFFIFCALAAIPGILLLLHLSRANNNSSAPA